MGSPCRHVLSSVRLFDVVLSSDIGHPSIGGVPEHEWCQYSDTYHFCSILLVLGQAKFFDALGDGMEFSASIFSGRGIFFPETVGVPGDVFGIWRIYI